jgi:hypothetical protein
MGEHAKDPPPGLQITECSDGRWTVRHSPGGIGRRGLGPSARLLWTCINVLLLAIGAGAFAAGGAMAYVLLAVVVLGIVVQVLLLGIALWIVSSVTTFTFGPQELVVVRSLFVYRRRKAFRQEEVKSVAQVQEGDAPFWTLEVTSGSRVKVLAWQPQDRSQWLGSRIAQWAGVPLETLWREKPEPVEWL